MCMNGLLVVMAFGPLLGLWPSSFFVLLCDHGLVISCSKIGQKPAKTKYLQNICANAKTTNNRAEVRMVSDFDTKFMPLSKLNRG